jgi:hypothetical protein
VGRPKGKKYERLPVVTVVSKEHTDIILKEIFLEYFTDINPDNVKVISHLTNYHFSSVIHYDDNKMLMQFDINHMNNLNALIIVIHRIISSHHKLYTKK